MQLHIVKDPSVDVVVDGVSVVQTIVTKALRNGDGIARVVPRVVGAISQAYGIVRVMAGGRKQEPDPVARFV